MRADELVFWLDVLPADADADAAVLCLRHADSMVLPRGWTLDDLRDPELHLFRPPQPVRTTRTRRPRAHREAPLTEQLRLGGEAHVTVPTDPELTPSTDEPGPWTPRFDEGDDLDGLLTAHSPLLSRAFRIADRPDS